jgi:hypothetical protein
MLYLLLTACQPQPVSAPLGPADADGSTEAPSSLAPIGSDPTQVDAPDAEYADWTVDCNGGGDFTTITEAIAAASDNEWIEVAPCTYSETVDYQGKTLWISSSGGSETTIIDASGGYGVIADMGTGDGTALVGFTIQDARGSYGAVYVYLAALRLEDVLITGAGSGYYTIYTDSGDLELQDVTIEDSKALYYMMYMSRGAVIADGLSVECQGGAYAAVMGHGSFFLDNTTLSCPAGYALYNENSVGRVHRSILQGATYASTDEDHYDDTNTFENTVVQGNMAQEYGSFEFRNSVLDGGTITATDVYDLQLEASVFQDASCAFTNTWSGEDTKVTPSQTVEYNDFYALTMEGCDGTTYSGADGNISADPEFTDATAGDYSTSATSPLIDAGMEDEAYVDPDGSRNDIGLYGGPRSLGGGW